MAVKTLRQIRRASGTKLKPLFPVSGTDLQEVRRALRAYGREWDELQAPRRARRAK